MKPITITPKRIYLYKWTHSKGLYVEFNDVLEDHIGSMILKGRRFDTDPGGCYIYRELWQVIGLLEDLRREI